MPFFDILRLQGDPHCACAQKWYHFSYFSKSFQTKKFKALRPKMTKIASSGGGGGGGPALRARRSEWNFILDCIRMWPTIWPASIGRSDELFVLSVFVLTRFDWTMNTSKITVPLEVHSCFSVKTGDYFPECAWWNMVTQPQTHFQQNEVHLEMFGTFE